MASPITVSPVMSGWPNVLRWSKIWKQPVQSSSIEYRCDDLETLSDALAAKLQELGCDVVIVDISPLGLAAAAVPQEYRQF